VRLLVVGAGSTGGYFGGRLAQAGRDVTFLVHPHRAELLRTDGLRIVSPHGDVNLHPVVVTAGSLTRPYDAILLAVKAYSLNGAIEDFAPAVGAKTLIVPVLNGMKHLEILAARFGTSCLVGGLCFIATSVDEAGRIVQLTEQHEIAYGELNGTSSARIQALDNFMKGAAFDARLSATVEREMWEKWVLLASMGAITCLLRGTIGEVQAVPGGADVTHRLLKEVTDVVDTVGVKPSDAFLSRARTILTASGSKQASSMYRDLERGSPIEADQIIGDLLARAQKQNISTPLLAAAYAQLSIYESRQRRA
jgi:2-dehydropantoate 2-reductase